MDKWKERTAILLGEKQVNALKNAKVAVFGLGGVGSFAVEALARAGVGHIALVDKDCVDETNINRQLIALRSTLGMTKTDVMATRINDICPDIYVEKYALFYQEDTAHHIDLSKYDCVVDAIDTMRSKIELIARAYATGAHVVSCMGAGNRLDPTTFQVADIYETSVCPVARIIRRALRERGVNQLRVIYSKEVPKPINTQVQVNEEKKITTDYHQKSPLGSISFVPSTAGLILAGEAIRLILEGEG